MKLIVGGHDLWRDAALIRDVLQKCQNSTDAQLQIVPAAGRCGAMAKRVASREGYAIIDPPALPTGASTDALNKALVEAHNDADMMLVFHDNFFRGKANSKLKYTPKLTATSNLTDKGVATNMGIILVTHQHGTIELN